MSSLEMKPWQMQIRHGLSAESLATRIAPISTELDKLRRVTREMFDLVGSEWSASYASAKVRAVHAEIEVLARMYFTHPEPFVAALRTGNRALPGEAGFTSNYEDGTEEFLDDQFRAIKAGHDFADTCLQLMVRVARDLPTEPAPWFLERHFATPLGRRLIETFLTLAVAAIGGLLTVLVQRAAS